MTNNEIKKINDILAKWEFILGQRAGRELWVDKPKHIQEEDLKNFRRDIEAVKDLINRLQAEKERLQNLNNEILDKYDKCIDKYDNIVQKQSAENERLNKFLNMTRKVSLVRRDQNLRKDELLIKMAEELETAKAEAYTKFFQLIHKELTDISNGYFESKNIDACVVMQGAIDKLRETYKEKVGEDNA